MPEIVEHTGLQDCACSACSAPLNIDPDRASVDQLAGAVASNGKEIWSAEDIAAYLNRTGGGWGTAGNQQSGSDGDYSVINFGFHTGTDSLWDNGYVFVNPATGRLTAFSEYFNFAPFSATQQDAAREAMGMWDDLVAVTFRESSINDADIAFGNLASAPTTQAYAYLPNVSLDLIYGGQVGEIGGDVWISLSQANNLQLDEGLYGIHTLVHEVGHALGLSHPGAYNAAPGVSITYGANAEYYQDTRVYSIMSYFNASSIGARHFDFNISTTVYAATPLIHDILAIQSIYGADMTTRTGDTTYGFNSNADRDSFDFTLTPAPIMAIWDAGGIDTIDASGYATDQIIDLRDGHLSSIGGVTYDSAPSFEQVNANRAAAGLAPIARSTYDGNMAVLAANPIVGRLTDNVGIAYGAIIENAVGGTGNDLLVGNAVDNVLKGGAGDDGLAAGGGNDLLDGGTGSDTMVGGLGDDLYIVDDLGDLVQELLGEGTDTVASSIDYALVDHVENLVLTGEAIEGTGNALDNILMGNALGNRLDGGDGADILVGGDGVDYLKGGAGADIFVAEINSDKVSAKSGSISLDVVLDFEKGVDKIDLSFLDANVGLDGHQAFNWKGHAAGKGAGDLSMKTFGNINAAEKSLGIDIDGIDGKSPYDGPVTVLFGDVDGDGADFAMVFLGTKNLGVDDLILVSDGGSPLGQLPVPSSEYLFA